MNIMNVPQAILFGPYFYGILIFLVKLTRQMDEAAAFIEKKNTNSVQFLLNEISI